MKPLSGLSGRLFRRESDFTLPLREGRAKRGEGMTQSAARLSTVEVGVTALPLKPIQDGVRNLVRRVLLDEMFSTRNRYKGQIFLYPIPSVV